MPRIFAVLVLLLTASSLDAQVADSLLRPGTPVRVTFGEGDSQIRQVVRLKRLAGDTLVLGLNRRDELLLHRSPTSRAEIAQHRPATVLEVARGAAVGAGLSIAVNFLAVQFYQAVMGPEWEVRSSRTTAENAMIGGVVVGAAVLIGGGRRWSRIDFR